MFGLDPYPYLPRVYTFARTCNPVYLQRYTPTPGRDVGGLQSSQNCRVPVLDEQAYRKYRSCREKVWEACRKLDRQSGISSRTYPRSGYGRTSCAELTEPLGKGMGGLQFCMLKSGDTFWFAAARTGLFVNWHYFPSFSRGNDADLQKVPYNNSRNLFVENVPPYRSMAQNSQKLSGVGYIEVAHECVPATRCLIRGSQNSQEYRVRV